MSAACFTEFTKHFIKHTKCSKYRPVILILDNHDSHVSIETTDLTKENGVTLLMLALHCSHKLQLLDRSVYDPFKTFYMYNQAADFFLVSHIGKTFLIYHVAKMTLTPRNIRSGFAASGICPLNKMCEEEINFCLHMSRTGPTAAPMIAIQPVRQKTY